MLSQLHGSAFLDLEETKRIEIYQQVYPRKGRFLYDISGENYTLYNWLLILSLASSEPFARWNSPTQWAQAHKPSFRGKQWQNSFPLLSECWAAQADAYLSLWTKEKNKYSLFKQVKCGWLSLSPGKPGNGQRLHTTTSSYPNTPN